MVKGNYIEVVEIIRRLEGGMTCSFLCCVSNGKYYVAKGLELLFVEWIIELLCVCLVVDFGLPIPEYGYIYIDSVLLRYNLEVRSDLGFGDSFVLVYVVDAVDLFYS